MSNPFKEFLWIIQSKNDGKLEIGETPNGFIKEKSINTVTQDKMYLLALLTINEVLIMKNKTLLDFKRYDILRAIRERE